MTHPQPQLSLDAQEDRVNRTRSSALWAAYGDALGFISELTDQRGLQRRTGGQPLERPISWRRKVGGRQGVTVMLPEGCYSDDTQLRLSTSRAIGPGGFDVEAFSRIELPVWPSYALGGGRASKAAAFALSRSNALWFANAYPGWTDAGGNGAAMRIQPHVWAASRLEDPNSYLPDVIRNTVCTHGHPVALLGAALHAVALGLTLSRGRLQPEHIEELLEACESVPSLLRADPEVGGVWLGLREQAAGVGFEEAWAEASVEASAAFRLAARAANGGASAYQAVLRGLDLTNEAIQGSGVLTAIAAIALTWAEPSPRTGLLTAAKELGSDTDTIATMAGALYGAATAETPTGVLDASLIADEAARMAALASGKAASAAHAYPDLLHWEAPKTQADALEQVGGDLRVRGLGRVAEELGPSIAAQGGEFAWQWLRLESGQSVLIKRRGKLKAAAAPRPMSATSPRADLHRVNQPGSSSVTVRPGERDRERVDLDRAVAYLEGQQYSDEAIGRAMRRLAKGGTLEQFIALASVIRERLRP